MFATTLGGRGSRGAIFCDRKAKLVGRAMLRCSLCPACAPPSPGAALLGTARSWRAIVPFFTHLAREGRMTVTLGRRELLAALGGAAVAWPLVARAQQPQRVRRIGVFMPGVADDPEFQAFNAAFLQRLAELGWIVGRNVRIEYRWGAGDTERYRAIAAELVALAPDVVFGFGSATVSALQKATTSVPIVFANVADPVGGGLVASMARPGGNTTGFITHEFGFAGKWLELLKEMAPRITRAAVMRDSAIGSQIAMFGSIQSVAPSLGVELRPIDTRDGGEIERAISALAGEPNGGLIVA